MKSIVLVLIVVLGGVKMTAQSQAETFIKEAQQFLTKKEYQQAIMSLQDAINDLNTLVAGQIIEALPDEINGLTSTDENESLNASGMGMLGVGMQIVKSYYHPTNQGIQAEVMIYANSPMLVTVNMFIGNPAMMGEGYKSVRVGSRRAILKTDMEETYDDNGKSRKIRMTELQLPLSQTLITYNFRDFATEQEELAFASKLDIEKLSALIGE